MAQLFAELNDAFHSFTWSDDLFAAQLVFPVVGLVAYLVILKAIKDSFTSELRSKNFEIVHNLFLTLLSFSMLVLALYGAYFRAQEDGWFGLICSKRPLATMWDGPLGAVTYVFYLSKYYDFIDSFVLAFRGKPTIFLHVYHHGVMPLTCWTWLSMSFFEGAWWCVVANSFIHMMMYSYYLATVFGIKVWYKRYITSAQIVQFISGTVVCFVWLYFKLTDNGCTSTYFPFVWSNVINFTFLGLFVKFYLDTYKKSK